MRARSYLYTIVLASICLLAIGGCASRDTPTMEDYEKISIGMTYDEVVAVMGEPQKKRTALTMTNYEWQVDDKTAVISFQEKMVADHRLK